ncbi:MAG: ABC transporter substrate-binding protein [Burkholderiales bacterium]|jgi:branched-chain amino acid transport system substrate-binding protein|nr:ABC transporter substrate-binding protein [Burkholderiales bacterium]MCA3224428.1 ABC transporter substrate-binding protein [Burkholderiales bacterium]MCE2644130.1 ABC transporter substrate-binding protein [Burkholderiaceae bacterium]
MFRSNLAAAALVAGLAGAPAYAQTVKVGIAQDLTGPFAALGAEARDGFNLAIKQLGNRLGGVNAEFIMQDMAGNPDTARQLVERFTKRERVDFFTGPIGSNVALAVGPALFAERVFYLSNNAGPSQLAGSQCNPFFFGTAYQNDSYHEAAGRFAASRDFKRVAIMAPNYPAGQDALNGFKRGFGKPVASETFTKLGQLDYAAEIAQLRAARPDALFIFLPGGMGINFIKQFVGAGLSKDTQIIGPGFSADQDVIRAVGDSMLGMFNTAHWNHDFDNAASRAFVEAFRTEYKRTPSIYAAQAYDVIMMIDAAVREVKGKVSDRDAVRAALKKASFKSVRGDFRFGNNQFPVQDFVLRVVRKDERFNGELNNRTLNKVMEKHVDTYATQCTMK